VVVCCRGCILQCAAVVVNWSALQCSYVCCSALQQSCVAVRCSSCMLQCVVVVLCCSALP